MDKKKIALLIDYDNFNQEKYFPILFDELNEVGNILIKYAFYSNLNDGKIKEKFIKFGIEPIAQIAYSTGKNAVDIRMTIEAMDLLGKDYIDCICIATNDSDFTPLILKLQKHDKYVVGAGDNKAVDHFKNACDYFISVEKITSSKKVSNKDPMTDLIDLINGIIKNNHEEDNFADFSYVIQKLKNQMKDFNPKNYGASNKQVLQFFQKELSKYFELKKKGKTFFIKQKSN